MQFESTLITQYIIIKVVIDVITIGRSLPLDYDKIFDVCT